MGIFDFFKKKNKKDSGTKYSAQNYHYDIDSLNDIFKTDFENFNPEEFNRGKRFENEGSPHREYFTEFESEEANVFKYLKVKLFDSGGRNYIFYTYKPNKYHRDNLRRLVVKLHSLYGPDDRGKGIYNEDDEAQMTEDDFWTGRTYTKHPEHPHLTLYYDDESGLNLTVFKKK